MSKMKILDRAGLAFMALGIITGIIYSFVACYMISAVPHFDFKVFCPVVIPALFVTGMTLLDRLLGGLLATLFSIPVLALFIYSRFSTIDTKADTAWFIITICFLLGGACILASLVIHTRKINTKA